MSTWSTTGSRPRLTTCRQPITPDHTKLMPVSLIKRLRARLAGSARADHGQKYNINDPRWGHKAQEGRRPSGNNDEDGPPDLDQLWRDFNQRLNRFFGKR